MGWGRSGWDGVGVSAWGGGLLSWKYNCSPFRSDPRVTCPHQVRMWRIRESSAQSVCYHGQGRGVLEGGEEGRKRGNGGREGGAVVGGRGER
jgi:hypothetical protein